MKKTDLIEIISVTLCLIFAIAISLYHVSFNGYLGLSDKFWGSLWAISENGFALTLSLIISFYFSGVMRVIFRYVFVPYFVLKLVYHFSCYSGIYLMNEKSWSNLWGVVLVILFIVGLGYCLILIHKHYA